MKLLTLVLMVIPVISIAADLDTKKPIDITADSLVVQQEQQRATFTGNVLAKQGNVNMKAAQMVVHYRQGNSSGNNVSKIEASGNVLFTTPEETAQSDKAIYQVDEEKIYLLENVVLTREQNILKGAQLEYNMATGRSVIGGGTSVAGEKISGGRVRGVFVPGGGQ